MCTEVKVVVVIVIVVYTVIFVLTAPSSIIVLGALCHRSKSSGSGSNSYSNSSVHSYICSQGTQVGISSVPVGERRQSCFRRCSFALCLLSIILCVVVHSTSCCGPLYFVSPVHYTLCCCPLYFALVSIILRVGVHYTFCLLSIIYFSLL